ncbi:MAG: hypothetical protein ACKPCP_21925, partial [Sphaerospermopsis kisseleviana]
SMHALTIKKLETIENILGHIATMSSDKEIKHQFFLARKSIHNAICTLLEDKEEKEDAPERDRKK